MNGIKIEAWQWATPCRHFGGVHRASFV